ncbi:hypothetical protein GCM10027273_19010 [Nocardioides pakistanensis]
MNVSRDAPACASSRWCCSTLTSKVNLKVVGRVNGTPVCDTSVSAVPAATGTEDMVPGTTDNATDRDTRSYWVCPYCRDEVRGHRASHAVPK